MAFAYFDDTLTCCAGTPLNRTSLWPLGLSVPQAQAVETRTQRLPRILRDLADRETRGELDDAKWSSVADELARVRRASLPTRWRR